MKKLTLLSALVIGLGLAPAFGQMGPAGGSHGPNFSGALNKLFGANQAFSASLEFHTGGDSTEGTTLPGKISFDAGKSRFEMHMGEAKGAHVPPAQQMKAMGMDTIIAITRPDLKLGYLVYPSLNSYAVMPPQDPASTANPDDFTMETADLGKETVDTHDCTKSKVTVTDKESNKHIYTVWNAADLKNFPIKITTSESEGNVTIQFKNITLAKPDASLFEAPASYTKYDSVQALVMEQMKKRMPPMGAPAEQN